MSTKNTTKTADNKNSGKANDLEVTAENVKPTEAKSESKEVYKGTVVGQGFKRQEDNQKKDAVGKAIKVKTFKADDTYQTDNKKVFDYLIKEGKIKPVK